MKKRELILIVVAVLIPVGVLYARPALADQPEPGPAAPKPVGNIPRTPANYPRQGLVALWRGEGNAADSVGKNHGRLMSGATFAPGRTGQCFKLDGKDDYIDFGSPKALQITGSQTIAMWVKPSRLGVRQNPIGKAYGGEGMINIEPTGNLNYMYGSSGGNGPPYAVLTSFGKVTDGCFSAENITVYKAKKTAVEVGRWAHIVVVRDLEAKRLRWYVNGQLVTESSLTITRVRASSLPLCIGKGYVKNFAGLIDEAAIWSRALSAYEIRALVGAPSGVARGLVGYWPADGNAKDAVGDSHGKAIRSPKKPPAVGPEPPVSIKYTADRRGAARMAFDFRDTWDFVRVPDSKTLDTDDAFTLSAWVKPSKRHHGYLILKHGRTPNQSDYALSFIIRDRIHFAMYNGADHQGFDSKSPLPMGKWTHVAVTFNRPKIEMFLNGKLHASFTSRIKHTNRDEYDNDDVTIGGWSSGGDTFDGVMDDVAIWKRALSAAEVSQVFEAPDLASIIAFGAAPYIKRIGQGDRLIATSGDVLIGNILNDKYVLTTSVGKFEIPAARVAGLAPEKGNPERVWLLLVDGQALCGKLAAEAVKLKLSTGSTLTVPIAKIRECGYQITEAKPARRESTRPLVELTDGQRLAWIDEKVKLQFQTAHGKLALAAESLLSVEPHLAGHRAGFINGSTLSGLLADEKISMKLQLGVEANVRPGQIHRLTWPARAAKIKGPATVTLRSGDKLLGEVADEALTVRTEFGEVKLRPGAALTITFSLGKDGKGVQVKAVTWDSGTISGQLAAKTITVAIGAGGPKVKVAASAIASITRSAALPPPAVVKRIKKLIAQLGAPNFKDREDATAKLIRIGRPAIELLKKHRKDTDPEIRQRIEKILDAITPKKASDPKDAIRIEIDAIGPGPVIRPLPPQ